MADDLMVPSANHRAVVSPRLGGVDVLVRGDFYDACWSYGVDREGCVHQSGPMVADDNACSMEHVHLPSGSSGVVCRCVYAQVRRACEPRRRHRIASASASAACSVQRAASSDSVQRAACTNHRGYRLRPREHHKRKPLRRRHDFEVFVSF